MLVNEVASSVLQKGTSAGSVLYAVDLFLLCLGGRLKLFEVAQQHREGDVVQGGDRMNWWQLLAGGSSC